MDNDDSLGPMPDAFTQDPELQPGGTDAVEEDPADIGLGRDLQPEDNPAVDDELPEQIAQPDDKSQAPDGDGDDKESGTTSDDSDDSEAPGPESDSPDAGQKAEDGSVEPPA
jgi:hypothetical protein